MKYLEVLESLHPEIIDRFLTTGESSAISPDVQAFIRQIQWAAEVYETERNVKRAAKVLRSRIAALQGLVVDIRTCESRIYAAISYFSIENNVPVKIWETDFANKYEDLVKLAVASDDLRTAKAAMDAAHECRRRASEAISEDEQRAPIFLITTTLSEEDLGFRKKNLKEIAKKSNDGYYVRLIDSLPIEKADKQRLLRDADIEDTEYEEIHGAE
jgi:hypothetical protein